MKTTLLITASYFFIMLLGYFIAQVQIFINEELPTPRRACKRRFTQRAPRKTQPPNPAAPHNASI